MDYNNKNIEQIPIFAGDVNKLIKESDIVVVASGTASLQTALYEKPMIVVYTVNPISYWVIKTIIKTKFISLVNIVSGEEVVPELIQKTCNSKKIVEYIQKYINDVSFKNTVIEKLKKIIIKLGNPGASERAAKIITNMLDS